MSYVLSSKYTRDQVARTADKALRRGGGPCQQHRPTGKIERTYNDAREADERQDEGHVRFSGRDTAARFERIYGLSAAQDPREQQALSYSIQYTASIAKEGFFTNIRHYPREQYLRKQTKSKISGHTQGEEGRRFTFVRTLA